MAVNLRQKQSMLQRTQAMIRKTADLNKEINALDEEFVAESYGTITSQPDVDSYVPTAGHTVAEYTSSITALNAVSTAIETNATNLYNFAEIAPAS